MGGGETCLLVCNVQGMLNWQYWTIVFLVEQMKQQQRALRKTNRDLERDRGAMERQERQLVGSIKVYYILNIYQ